MAWWALVGVALASVTPPTSPTTPDPLGCEAVVFDPAGELDAAAVEAEAARTASTLGAEVHVRAEGSVDAGLDQRMAQLEAQCPGWTSGGERAGDLVVVMYSSAEREASVFYGADLGLTLEARWERAVDEMIERLAAGDATGGVLDGLRTLREPGVPDPFSDDSDTERDGGAGVPPIVWLVLVGVVVVAVVRVVQYARTGEWDTGPDDSSWSRRSSRRSWSSSSSTRRSSSRRMGGGSSTRRRGRAGGGSKRW